MFRKKGKLSALLVAVLTLTLVQSGFLPIYATEINGGPSGRTAENIAVNSDNFPDQTFLEEIELRDIDGDKVLSASEIQNITALSFSREAGISSLQGIEYLTALETLHVAGNNLTELDVTENTSLRSLICDDNSIETLTLGENLSLTELSCSSNLLTSLDLSGVPNLVELDCGDNVDLSSLDISGNLRLQNLICWGNDITTLNVSYNKELTSLDCSFNNLTELNVTSNEKLEELFCQYNALKSLDLANNLLLTNVDVSGNQLTSLDLDDHGILTEANFMGGAQRVSLGNIPGNRYDLSSFDSNIDGNKISNASGAAFQGTVMSGYQNGTPVTYEYLCSDQGLKLGVTLNFNAQDMTSSITYMDGAAEFSSWTTDYAGQQPISYEEGMGVQLPTAENIAKEGYTFTGWYKNADLTGDPVTEISAVDQGDQILYAKFEINTYQVTFQDMNGNLIGTAQTVEHGQSAEAPQAPDVEGYRFTGWSTDFSNVTGPLTVTAQYIKTWTVTFVDDNGTVLKTETVDDGTAAIPPAAPTKTGHTFAGWDTAYTNITGDTTVTATYTTDQYTVTFTNWDGTVLETQTVAYGAAAVPTVTPFRDGYRFTGWSADLSNVTGSFTVTAQYIKTWTVTFLDDNGTVLKTETVDEGAAATAPAAPAKPGYTFAGWNTAYTNITGDTVVTATYTANQYTVTFVDWNGTVLETQTVAHGAAAVPTVTPARAGYTFIGWDTAFTNVTGNLTVAAQYEAVPAPAQASPVTAVKTGDQSNIILLLAVAGAALALAVGASAYRYMHKKKK